jgi:hypothetical protein
MNTLSRITKLRIKQIESKITFIRSLMRLKFFDIRISEAIIIVIGKAEISNPISDNHTPKNDLDSNINMKNSKSVITRNV